MQNNTTTTKNLDKKREDALKKGIIYLNEDFTSESMEYVMHALEDLHANKNIETIEIRINSNGGYTDSLFALIDWIDRAKRPITTTVLGKAYSCGAFLLLSGTKGHRRANRHSMILLHEVANDNGYGQVTHQEDNIERMRTINDFLKNLLLEKTTMQQEDIKKYMEEGRDRFITAEQALAHGIIDQII